MEAPGRRNVVHPTLHRDWKYDDGNPMAYHVEEEIGPTGTKEDTWEQNDSRRDIDYARSSPDQGSNRTVLTLLIFFCLMAIAALVLTILMLFGKIGCGRCFTNEGQSV